jgi:hypothetical protein
MQRAQELGAQMHGAPLGRLRCLDAAEIDGALDVQRRAEERLAPLADRI